MGLPFQRNFKNGRQSEQFLNDELITLYEMIKYLPYYKTDHLGKLPPNANIKGALNVQPSDEALNYWDTAKNQWVPFFKSKFQIVDQLLAEICPANPVVGQLWLNNGVLCYFDGAEWKPVKSIQMDDSQWSSAAFSDFQIVSPLNPSKDHVVDIGGSQYVVSKTEALEQTVDDYWKYHYDNQLDYETNATAAASSNRWDPNILSDGTHSTVWTSPEPQEPTRAFIDNSLKAQFLVPNLKNDRIFLSHILDRSYDPISSVCFQYPVSTALDNTISAVHINPGKITKITKRLIKVDKNNSTINLRAFNTEFYGFRNEERGGDLLVPSDNQDSGDYIPSGDYIILNYDATQSYDYILAITYEFTWVRAEGSMQIKSLDEMTSSFYLANLHNPINVHVNGMKLEEASYNVDLESQVVTIDEDASDVTINAWSPYSKQFGYIRETDLLGRGIIKLHKPVHIPLVFVGGLLMHPLYSGLEFDGDKIYVPNSGGLNQMKTMQWCVVDLVSEDYDVQYNQSGTVVLNRDMYSPGTLDHFEEPDEMYYAGTLVDEDNDGIQEYILSSGVFTDVEDRYLIRYSTEDIGPDDGILLFINGLMVNREDIIRDDTEGTIELRVPLEEGQEYVLLKDRNEAIYDSTSMIPAFGMGYVSDSLVYFNGKLLAEPSCVLTLLPPERVQAEGVVDGEVKFFITNEQTGDGTWKRFDEFNNEWVSLKRLERENVSLITGSYENQLTAIRLNCPYNRETDTIIVYGFRFANAFSGIIDLGIASYYDEDENDGLPIYVMNSKYGYGSDNLNVYRNGVKMIKGIDYVEMPECDRFKFLYPISEDGSLVQFAVEPIEHGQDIGHKQVVLTKDNALQLNVYKISDDVDISLYPGRVTLYINGIRIPKEDWTLVSNKAIMLKYDDFKAVGSTDNYPDEIIMEDDEAPFTVTHTYPDVILAEIRYDYDRQEKTIYLDEDDIYDLDVVESGLGLSVLESADEILFYLNGQFTGLSRNKNTDYKLDQYSGCITFLNSDFLEATNQDPLKNLLDMNGYMYMAWKKLTGKTTYKKSEKKNTLTIVWR